MAIMCTDTWHKHYTYYSNGLHDNWFKICYSGANLCIVIGCDIFGLMFLYLLNIRFGFKTQSFNSKISTQRFKTKTVSFKTETFKAQWCQAW